MKIEIENLKAWIYGKNTTGYQKALAIKEFDKRHDAKPMLPAVRISNN